MTKATSTCLQLNTAITETETIQMPILDGLGSWEFCIDHIGAEYGFVEEILLSRQPIICLGSHRLPWGRFAEALITLQAGTLFHDVLLDFRAIMLVIPTNRYRDIRAMIYWPPRNLSNEDVRLQISHLIEEAGGLEKTIDLIKKSVLLVNEPPMSVVLATFYTKFQDGETDLLQCLMAVRTRDATQDRDRIYGFLRLFKPSSIVPSISKPLVKIYIEAVMECIRQSHTLDVLSACVGFRRVDYFMLNVANIETPPPEFPSWVPDWRVHHINNAHLLLGRISCITFRASGPSLPEVHYYETGGQGVLQISEIILSTV